MVVQLIESAAGFTALVHDMEAYWVPLGRWLLIKLAKIIARWRTARLTWLR